MASEKPSEWAEGEADKLAICIAVSISLARDISGSVISVKAMIAGMRPVIATALDAARQQGRREGAESMREAAAKTIRPETDCWLHIPLDDEQSCLEVTIRALPLPGEGDENGKECPRCGSVLCQEDRDLPEVPPFI